MFTNHPQLRHEYHASQEEITRLQKEIVTLKEQMEKKNEAMFQLNHDIDILKESLAKRWAVVSYCDGITYKNLCSKSDRGADDHELEIESLRDIIEQYKRTVKSLVDEIDLKKLHETERDRRVDAEKQ